MYQHIRSNNILAKEEYGFKTNSSTEIATYTLINIGLSSLNNTLCVGGLFLQFKKAFNCVNHEILKSKLNLCGIIGTANKLIRSYLLNRYQTVTINDLLTCSMEQSPS